MDDQALTVTVKGETFADRGFVVFLRRRVNGFWRFLSVYQALTVLLFILVCFIVWVHLPPEDLYRPLAGAVIATGLVLLLRWMCRFANARIHERWFARGVPRQFITTYTITHEGLHQTSEFGAGVTYWTVIHEIARHSSAWLLITAGSAIFIDHESFETPAKEREFIAAVMSHLTPAAQARSTDAQKFLGTSA